MSWVFLDNLIERFAELFLPFFPQQAHFTLAIGYGGGYLEMGQ